MYVFSDSIQICTPPTSRPDVYSARDEGIAGEKAKGFREKAYVSAMLRDVEKWPTLIQQIRNLRNCE